TPGELEVRSEIRFIGMLPHVPSLQNSTDFRSYILAQPLAPYVEAVRAVRNVIDLQDQMRSVAVVSALPEEGKSSLAMAIAHSWARSGARTIIVDCDLRRPTLTGSLKNAKVGLTDFLTRTLTTRELIRHDEAMGYDYMLAGDLSSQATFQFSVQSIT